MGRFRTRELPGDFSPPLPRAMFKAWVAPSAPLTASDAARIVGAFLSDEGLDVDAYRPPERPPSRALEREVSELTDTIRAIQRQAHSSPGGGGYSPR